MSQCGTGEVLGLGGGDVRCAGRPAIGQETTRGSVPGVGGERSIWQKSSRDPLSTCCACAHAPPHSPHPSVHPLHPSIWARSHMGADEAEYPGRPEHRAVGYPICGRRREGTAAASPCMAISWAAELRGWLLLSISRALDELCLGCACVPALHSNPWC